MDYLFYLAGGAAAMLLLLLLGAPIFIAFAAVIGVALLLTFGTAGGVLLVNSIVDTATTGALTAVPLFILMGEILFRSGAVAGLVRSVDRLFGLIWGRQYFVTLSLSVVFGALSGSAVAVTAMLGRSMLPAMLDDGYDERLSIGTVLAGASLAPIIPPSILVILVGALADQSIARLLIAGIVPGLFIASLCIVYIALRGRIDGKLAPANPARSAESGPGVAGASLDLMLVFLVILTVLGLIVLGLATPSESAAFGVIGALLLGLRFGGLSRRGLASALGSTVLITGSLMIILAMAKLFGQLLAYTGATGDLVGFVQQLGLGPAWMLVVLMLIPFFSCMILDQVAFAMVIIPLYEPLLETFGYEPTWFWMLLLVNLTLGGMTPPFGYTLFALQGARRETAVRTLFGAAWPFVGIFIVAIAVMMLFPELVSWLPARIYG